MKRRVFRHYRFFTGIFHCEVHLVVCAGDRFGTWVKNRYDCDEGLPEGHHVAECIEMRQDKGGSDFILWFREFSLNPESQLLLVHETHHLVTKILKHVGAVNTENDEVAAHLQDHLFQQCWRRLAR